MLLETCKKSRRHCGLVSNTAIRQLNVNTFCSCYNHRVTTAASFTNITAFDFQEVIQSLTAFTLVTYQVKWDEELTVSQLSSDLTGC